jgi:predicted glycosyltransferase
MNDSATFNILMYSHDTYGLGHIRRTMAIAEQLRGYDTNILILTGSPIAGRLNFPKQVDYVRVPGMIKKANNEYFPLTIRIDPKQAMDIRQSIIMATVSTFLPDLFIVDKEPQGLKKEVLPALEWIAEHSPKTRTILGLRDIMDEAGTVIEDWEEKGVYQTIAELYDEVWIYGRRDFYDPIEEYRISDKIREKIHFTGYIPRRIPAEEKKEDLRYGLNIMNNENLITVTTGGGGDGYFVLDSYLTMLEQMKEQRILPPFQTIMVTGPFLSKDQKDNVLERAANLEIHAFEFFSDMETLISASDLVVCMGGYNTICETLCSKTMSLIIPREYPRKEQYIRAKAFHEKNLIEYIKWNQVDADALKNKIMCMLENKDRYETSMQKFEMTGIARICDRIFKLREDINGGVC